MATSGLVCVAPARAEQATLVGDVEITSAMPDQNHGTLAHLDVGHGFTSLLQFDLSLLPSGVTASNVSRAVLQLYVERVTTPGAIAVAPATSAWNEFTVTYNTSPLIGSPTSSVPVSQVGTFVAIDVTSLVQGWLSNPASNYGLALTADTAYVQFDSKENEQTSHAAILDIQLTDPSSTGPAGPQGPVGPQGPIGATGPAGPATGLQLAGSLTYPGLVWATSATTATLATRQLIANTLVDPSGTSMYLSSANPTAPGPDNVVLGAGAGSHLALGAGNGGEGSVIIGYGAAAKATSAREDVIIGNQAGAALTGWSGGSSAEDSVVVLLGSLAGAALTSTGTIDTVMIGQKAGVNDSISGEDTMVGNHAGVGITTSNGDTLMGYNAWSSTNYTSSYYDTIIGSGAGGYFPQGYASSYNTGVGYDIFTSIGMNGTGGQYNTTLGALSGANITSGTYNLCLGFQTCGTASPNEGVMTGDHNVYINTPEIRSTSARNNFVAMDGGSLTTGNNNLVISQLSALTSGSDNVCLGLAACQFMNGWEYNNVAVGFGANTGSGVVYSVELGGGINTQPFTLAFDGFSFLNSSGMFTEVLTTPSSSSAPCNPGQFTDDANYHYVCTAPNTWKRVALSSF